MQPLPLFKDEYLFSHWETEYREYLEVRDARVLQALREWDARDKSLSETQLDGLFVTKIFHGIWGYWGTGTQGPSEGYTLFPQYAVPGAGQAGGTGKADLALGNFANLSLSDIPQALCEFKDIRSGLDTPQKRKGNRRSPVKQCLDYLKYSFDRLPVNPQVTPTWGIVTDMNEFRLYYRRDGDSRCQRFVISATAEPAALIGDARQSAEQRFLFCKLFACEQLLASHGSSELEKLLGQQWTLEKDLEKSFYREYQAYRQQVYESIIEANPTFKGTRGELVTMTQRFLDRCIFLLFCEDMGKALDFPTDLLRDILIHESTSKRFSPDFDNIWSLVKQLFKTMKEGGEFPPNHRIHKFNGGLFEDLDVLESLRIPNRVFCAQGQGESQEKLREFKNTLLYLSATYNFGATSAERKRTITLYALGRIFEQSITDLEYMHAEADGTPTVAKLSKRRRDGVYYTPEWVTHYIVQEVIGRRCAEERASIGLELGREFKPDEISRYLKAKKKPQTNPVTIHIQQLDRYSAFLDRITVLDPACGSGAFLIQALQFLQQQRHGIAAERARVTGTISLFDQDAVIRSILANNLYGVDINPESVEITQLALWLNTASPGKPLSTLDQNIRCGNSLVGREFASFFNKKHDSQKMLFEDVKPAEREKVNVFDWSEAFPEILGPDIALAQRGFDCVIGNPPYVKLQHFRMVIPDVAEYLAEATIAGAGSNGTVVKPARVYESTSSKNFDLYLPFIERGVSLLNTRGHLGFIAPSVWLLNEYGFGLKSYLLNSRRLARWVDFKDFPVFEEAMTYTALQFYRGSPVEKIAFASARDGQLSTVQDEGLIDYDTLDPNDAWVFLPDSERSILDRLSRSCTSLIDSSFVASIFQGIITSADYIYHLDRIGRNRYRHFPPKGDPEDVEIEDDIMRPLLSGTEAKRYQSPKTNTYLMFPYDEAAPGRPVLFDAATMATRYPKAWNHLCRYESALRARERSAFDDDQWYRFGRNQSIDKQSLPKLGVAQTVPEMRVFFDSAGEFCLNNVRVNGILVHEAYAWFVLGILNSRVCDFVFRRISKPKEPRPSGAYFEANKQYIAPLPIPTVDDSQRERVTELAKQLQALHSQRRDTIESIDKRIASSQMTPEPKEPNWIWADVHDVAYWRRVNPKKLVGRALSSWSKEHFERLLADKIAAMDDQMAFGQTMLATFEDGQLKFFVGDQGNRI